MRIIKLILLGILTACSITAYAAIINPAQLDFTLPPPDGALTPDQTPPMMMPITLPKTAPATVVNTVTTTTVVTPAPAPGPGTPTPTR